MEKKNLMPQQAQPIERITTGQLPDVLAELSEEALWQQEDSSGGSINAGVIPQGQFGSCNCSVSSGDYWSTFNLGPLCSFDEAE
ncbi:MULTISPECIES: DUF5837 family cyanobactin class RiPP [Kamptonema]|uniref:DUF5837 family cyanobactin class RiPP n=1 Tax=Kamptonema TaxID=1501433 RepID=UPI0001DACDB4|nr:MULTISPECIES: DUF5837 family cyanobactin class RiPP [Kamptonema]CBN56375.1 putative TenE [Kamptonema sp. PCC 6506]